MTIESNNFVLFLMGPTASGKTELAIKISKIIDSTLISVDSALIYKGMDIGTAKPDKETLINFPHELIDICNPEDSFSVTEFITLAKKHINTALNKGKLPILVGGTSFYFNALEHGLSSLPASTDESRKHFNNLLQKMGSEKLHEELQEIDPKSAERIHPNDSQRITRALEVHKLSGETLSALRGNKNQNKLDLNIKKIVLMPDRSILHKRIEDRFIEMIKNGFLDEVKSLRKNQKLNLDIASMRCVGYRQAWNYFEGLYSKKEMVEKAIVATRQLCKRQCTWLRDENSALILKQMDIDKAINYLQERDA
ncbi:MAG: tRNA (adenosine(37)-N6)-dimethylallyltransferase MiaA [Thiotrichales bacterium]|jgi:tRNA dimethylallyltransferase|nr:tRNA (adenosine(37)-N6)-dimethylallyltransferase MiaA [Thiotrichales bacterium]MBT7438710.1 tRNA (adenosine(37)-N6)-dimethylallyltransferase MiaA [Thiotrichales bacterium]MBT7933768.1 tRNA (adenosine(37)-N6)-dimethylallyltransferase MiaA [Thiotrichales bacterium]